MPSQEATVAAAWWADKIRHHVAPDNYGALERFEHLLGQAVDERFEAAPGYPVPLTTSDCGPQLNLSRPVQDAGLQIGSSAWPLETYMFVGPGNVYVYEGYNTHRQTLIAPAT
jgi:hypothetical protein